MASFKIEFENQPRKFWRTLKQRPASEQEAFARAVAALAEKPLPLENPPGTIKHLKGEHHCSHEYRTLPNAQRIFYKAYSKEEVDKEYAKKGQAFAWDDVLQKGLIIIYYAGPHP